MKQQSNLGRSSKAKNLREAVGLRCVALPVRQAYEQGQSRGKIECEWGFSVAERVDLRGAISELVNGGDSVALEGFTHLIPSAAAHEIIRQERKQLTLIRMTPDLVHDQMIGMGCAEKLVFPGEPGVHPGRPASRRDGRRGEGGDRLGTAGCGGPGHHRTTDRGRVARSARPAREDGGGGMKPSIYGPRSEWIVFGCYERLVAERSV